MGSRKKKVETEKELKPREQMSDAEKVEEWRRKRGQQGTLEKPGGRKRTKDI
jgi:hypothetical protein